jgi:hypothetical protein
MPYVQSWSSAVLVFSVTPEPSRLRVIWHNSASERREGSREEGAFADEQIAYALLQRMWVFARTPETHSHC